MSERPTGTLVGTLQLFADITRFRKGPEDLPVSPALLGYCIIVGIGARALLIRVLPIPFQGNPLAVLVVDAVATLLFLSLVLNLAKLPERFLQTATAIFGFQLVMLPVLVGSGWLYLVFAQDAVWKLPVMMLNIAVEVWGLAVVARILSSATNWPLFACVVLAIAGDLLSFLAIVSLFPLTGATAAPA